LAPIQIMVLPLMAKDGLSETGREVTDLLISQGFNVDYDDAGTIGRRYARADEIGVPISITIDYQSLTDMTVTLRDRDSWQQVRNDWKTVPQLMRPFLTGAIPFSALGKPVKLAYE